MWIKICGNTSLDDTNLSVDAAADAVGFVFCEKSPRRVAVEMAAEISAKLPPYLMRVGVFVDSPADFVATAIQRCGLTLAQFHGQETLFHPRLLPLTKGNQKRA